MATNLCCVVAQFKNKHNSTLNYEDYVIIYIKIFSESGEISVCKGKGQISLLYAHDLQALGTTAFKKALFCHRNHCTALPEMYYSQMQVKA